MSPLIELVDVVKEYPGVKALAGVNLTLHAGTVTALAGENGAGKSTLIKVLAGAVKPDKGEARIGGNALPADPRSVIDAGVSVIYQELTDVPEMSIAENLLLGRQDNRFGFVNRKACRAKAREALRRVGLEGLDVTRTVSSLSISQRQLLEIARCLTRNAKVLVFDEPTSALAEADVEQLMEVIRGLRSEGLAILYVSHHLDELFDLANDIVVMRDGQIVDRRPTEHWTYPELVKTMLAKDLERAYPWRERTMGEQILEVSELHAPGVRNTSLSARRGEIVGLVGLAGAGRTELMKAISGVTRTESGKVTVAGQAVRPGSVTAARAAGIAYAPEDRKNEGLNLESSIQDNLLMGNYKVAARSGWLNGHRLAGFAQQRVKEFRVKTDSLQQHVGRLSGGNQQKVVLGRVAASNPLVILLDDPTRGVDVGSKSSIYEQVLDLAEGGASVFLTSSDTDEVLAMSDRSYVLRHGRIVGHVARDSYDRESILHLASLG